jgi:hypothetical protein
MKWYCNYCQEEHDSRDPNLFPPETFVHESEPEYIAKTAGEPIKPPHLRKGTATKNCLSCKMYHKDKGGKGLCWGYGEFSVDADDLCDSYKKETRGILSPLT